MGVQEVGSDFIRLDRLTSARPSARAAEDFGRALVRTHAAGAASFGQGPAGWSADGYIGSQVLTLRPADVWGSFYADQRLLPYAVVAQRIGHLSRPALALVERVCDRLHAGDWDDGFAASRIHGDLWSGNVMYTGAGVVLIDPAAHGGHALTDLAMLHLFGTPHLDTITGGYAESAGNALPDGWTDLIGLHQLHPLLVHAVTHGASYGHEAERVARRYA